MAARQSFSQLRKTINAQQSFGWTLLLLNNLSACGGKPQSASAFYCGAFSPSGANKKRVVKRKKVAKMTSVCNAYTHVNVKASTLFAFFWQRRDFARFLCSWDVDGYGAGDRRSVLRVQLNLDVEFGNRINMLMGWKIERERTVASKSTTVHRLRGNIFL